MRRIAFTNLQSFRCRSALTGDLGKACHKITYQKIRGNRPYKRSKAASRNRFAGRSTIPGDSVQARDYGHFSSDLAVESSRSTLLDGA
jgi:hypothetical protein